MYKDSTSSRRKLSPRDTAFIKGANECMSTKFGSKNQQMRQHHSGLTGLDFKTLYSSGETRLAMYADMGFFASQFSKPSVPGMSRHNVGNLVDDLAKGKIDFAVHSGDLAYEFEVNGGARGDGFMDGYSEFLFTHRGLLAGEITSISKVTRAIASQISLQGLIAEKTNECARESLALLDRHRLVHILQLTCRLIGAVLKAAYL